MTTDNPEMPMEIFLRCGEGKEPKFVFTSEAHADGVLYLRASPSTVQLKREDVEMVIERISGSYAAGHACGCHSQSLPSGGVMCRIHKALSILSAAIKGED